MNKQHLVYGLLIFGATFLSSFQVKEAPLWIALAVYGLLGVGTYFSNKGKEPFIVWTALYALFVFFTAGHYLLEKVFPMEEQLQEVQGLNSLTYGAMGMGLLLSYLLVSACRKGLKKQEQLFYIVGIIVVLLPSLWMQ